MLQIGLLLSIALLVGVDQLTKYLLVLYLDKQQPFPLIPEVFELQYSENTGAAFGILKNHPWVFMSITIVVLVVLTAVLMSGRYRRYKLANISGVLIVAGGAGNMIDRIFRGYVVDFLYFKPINFPIFNFADCCIVIGAALLLIFFFFIYREDGARPAPQMEEEEPLQPVSEELPASEPSDTAPDGRDGGGEA